MSDDLHLLIRKPGLWGRFVGDGLPDIAVNKPPELTKTKAGSLKVAPPEAWSVAGGYGSGDVDLARVRGWLAESLGDDVLDVIARLYADALAGDDGRFRVVLTAEREFLQEMMGTPWEALESFQTAQFKLPYLEHLSVVRVLRPEEKEPDPIPTSDKLDVAVIWANPYDDIDAMGQHLEELKKFFAEREHEFNLAEPVEFLSYKHVLDSLADVHPQIVYYIGHALQRPGQKVFLPIGRRGSEGECNVEDFRRLLDEIGPLRLLLLNACATTVGRELNTYLGAAVGCAEQVGAVISMQTEVAVEAATAFARGFFQRLAAGAGLAESVWQGRVGVGLACDRNPALPAFSPYIPVLLQRTLQDRLFTIDLTGRELRYLLLYLSRDIAATPLYLKRGHDEELAAVLSPTSSSPRVSLVEGPVGSGKTTSVTRLVRALNEAHFAGGDRYLYYKARPQELTGGLDWQIKQLLVSFAERLPLLLGGLKAQLNLVPEQQPGDALIRLASWFGEEARKGRNYCVCLDGVPPELARAVAERAASLLTQGGRLILVTEDGEVSPDLPVKLLTVAPMSVDEIRGALEGRGDAARADGYAEGLLKMSGGFPFFVAGYLRRGVTPDAASGGALAEHFLETYEPALSPEQMNVLRFAAHVDIPIPGAVFAKFPEHFQPEVVGGLVEDCLLQQSGDDSHQIPEALRAYLRDTTAPDFALFFHQLAAKGFYEVAADVADATDETTFGLVMRRFREAFAHFLACARLHGEEDEDGAALMLDEARSVASILHSRYVEAGHEVGAAVSMWAQYRDAAYTLDHNDKDRQGEFYYAECLARTGEYETALQLLDSVTEDEETDSLQVNALNLHNNVLKARGRSGDFALRLGLLERALAAARRLEESEPGAALPKQLHAMVEQSFGNLLGYGKNARPEEAIRHLAEAERLYAEVNDPSGRFLAVSERIEIKRYNGLLTAEERSAAIATLLENRSKLITRATRYDAIMHSYELGRLATDPADRVTYFYDAFRRAGDTHQPINWHAAISWRCAQIEAQAATFEEVAPELERYAEKLGDWHTDGWSRRTRRDTLQFLAENYQRLGQAERAFAAAERCWKAVLEIARAGEGRTDPSKRAEVADLYASLLLRHDRAEEARAVADMARAPVSPG
jgi:tetratricopeptide (TPR) repeat protein